MRKLSIDRKSKAALYGSLTETGAVQLLFSVIILFLTALSLSILSPLPLVDADTGWHLASGRLIVERLAVPAVDPFSYTFSGHPWIAHEWLAEVVMYGAFSLLKWNGVLMLFGFCLASTVTSIQLYASRSLPPVAASAIAAVVLVCLLKFMLARPHVIAWLLLALWTIALLRAREKGRAPPAATALLMLAWANIHASYIFGVGLVALFGLEAIAYSARAYRWAQVKAWGRFGLLSLIATFITPFGLRGLSFPFAVTSMTSLHHLAEWKPPQLFAISIFNTSLAAFIIACLIWPPRLPASRVLLVGVMLAMSFNHVRHEAIFAIVTALIVSGPAGLGRGWASKAAGEDTSLLAQIRSHKRAFLPISIVGAVLMIVLIGLRSLNALEPPRTGTWPNQALDHIPAETLTQPVFNDYFSGGALINRGIRVFIDGRADLYGDTFVNNYFRIVEDGDLNRWREADRRWHFQWIILTPGCKFCGWLDKQSDWRRAYTDDQAVVYVKTH